jgi:L,D-transpeptidase ErfK/SrfK
VSIKRLGRAIGSIALLMIAAAPASAAEFALAPNQAAIGVVSRDTTHADDTMMDVARRHDLGYAEFMAANPLVDPWLPGKGTAVVVPGEFMLPNAPRIGIVVNLGARRLFYFHPGGKTVETFPIGIGTEQGMTPLGTTVVTAREPNPTWYPPPSIRAERPELPAFIGPGPDNPLGEFALHLGWKNFLIHGTNKPDGVGRNVSHGCIRLYPEDIARLFHEVTVGTPVRFVDQAVLTGWIDGRLYIEIHPTREQVDQIDNGEPKTVAMPEDLLRYIAPAGNRTVDWVALRRAGIRRDGIPVVVTVGDEEAPISRSPLPPLY